MGGSLQRDWGFCFYDSMSFGMKLKELLLGNSVDDCLSIIITRDGGNNWPNPLGSKLPKVGV